MLEIEHETSFLNPKPKALKQSRLMVQWKACLGEAELELEVSFIEHAPLQSVSGCDRPICWTSDSTPHASADCTL